MNDLAIPDHPALALLPEAPTRGQIEAFGQMLQGLEVEHDIADLSTVHHQAQALYGRSIVVKAGTFLVGLPHKAGHLNVCVGDITVWTEGGRQRLAGAHILTSKAHDMRVGFAHADTTWLTVHATDLTDIAEIEDSLVEHPERLITRRTQPELRIAA